MADEKEEVKRMSRQEKRQQTDIIFNEMVVAEKLNTAKKVERLKQLRLAYEAEHTGEKPRPASRSATAKRNPYWK